MKQGMEMGQTASFSFYVTSDMFAQFEGEVVHEAYSTVSMVYHMEWAARQVILPYLEPHEEGIGGSVKVRHLAPTTKGTKVTVKATLTTLKDNIVTTKTEAWNEKGLIGSGEVIQLILPKKQIADKINASL